MLVAKINPVANLAKQDTPFSFSSVEANSIIVIARPYVLGAKNTNFEVAFGNVQLNEEGVNTFVSLLSVEASLNEEEMADWATDDNVVLNKVAEKVGTSVVSVEVL